jgi:hypothetical protein
MPPAANGKQAFHAELNAPRIMSMHGAGAEVTVRDPALGVEG